jgi:regulatory protein
MEKKSDASTPPFRRQGLTQDQALQKLRHFCGYQERSHHDATRKLWELGVQKAKHDEIVSTLIEEGYLNEERFAQLYVGGKFRMNEWGKKKILNGLREKQVSSYIIDNALKAIDEGDYQKKLQELTQKKFESIKGEKNITRKKKVMEFMLQKGYEPHLISQALAEIEKKRS